MRSPGTRPRGLANTLSRLGTSRRRPARVTHSRYGFWTRSKAPGADKTARSSRSTVPLAAGTGALLIWWLYPSDAFAQLSAAQKPPRGDKFNLAQRQSQDLNGSKETQAAGQEQAGEQTAWGNFANRFESFSLITDLQWSSLSDALVGFILPEWSKMIPSYVGKLQRELSLAPGSLADEIWSEAHDPLVNPEIRYSAKVRVSAELCDEEKEYLARRRKVTRVALARYLDIEEKDIHPDDVPTIAMCGSGGGLRALVAGTGSLLATEEDGLFDCVTYTAGVSGSCWLQALYLSSFSEGRLSKLLDHLKSRAGVHIAYPPVAFNSLVSLPTSKYLLSGLVEKLRGDAKADFGLVDVYGLLLATRYLVPKGDLGINERDFKLSNQRDYIKYGQNPMPIYTAVRHEIPGLRSPSTISAEAAKEQAKQESWFQWFEFTPYELFCEELGAGIPTWAIGRKFNDGKDVPPEHGFHLPEIRVPLLLGIFGSAFCATLHHYYLEISPIIRSMTGLEAIDNLISGKSEDLSKVHPFDPASIPNFAHGMHGKLPNTTPEGLYDDDYLQLMDAGMSNNLPIYPLLRPGRDVDILVTFDASADVKTDNWLSVAEGYARQRGIKGWPVGIGWPRTTESASQTTQELDEALAKSAQEAEMKVQEAQSSQEAERQDSSRSPGSNSNTGKTVAEDLGYCTVWVGTTEERSSEPPPPSGAVMGPDSWRLMEPNAGIAVVYLPLLANDKVPGASPGTSDFLSTWNFVYTPEQIESVVQLARANYDEGKEQIRSTVRAVYERKKKLREQIEESRRIEKYRAFARRGEAALLGEGDQFS